MECFIGIRQALTLLLSVALAAVVQAVDYVVTIDRDGGLSKQTEYSDLPEGGLTALTEADTLIIENWATDSTVVTVDESFRVGALLFSGNRDVTLAAGAGNITVTKTTQIDTNASIAAGIVSDFGKITVSDGQTLSLQETPAGTFSANGGTLALTAADTQKPIALSFPESAPGALQIAKDTGVAVSIGDAVKEVKLNAVGADSFTSKLTLSGAADYLITEFSYLENLQFRPEGANVTWEAGLDDRYETVVLDVPGKVTFTLGADLPFLALRGSGSIAHAEALGGMTLGLVKEGQALDFSGSYLSGALTLVGPGAQNFTGSNTSEGIFTVGTGTEATLASWGGDVTVASKSTLNGCTSVGKNLTLSAKSVLDVSSTVSVGGKVTVSGPVTLTGLEGKPAGTEVFRGASEKTLAGVKLANLSGAPAGLEFAFSADGKAIELALVDLAVTVESDTTLSKIIDSLHALNIAKQDLVIATGEKPVTVTVDQNITVGSLSLSGKGALKIVSASDRKLTVANKVSIAVDTEIAAGAAAFPNGYTIAKSAMLTLNESPAVSVFGKRLSPSGTLMLAAPDAKTVLSLDYAACTQDAKAGFGPFIIGPQTQVEVTVTEPVAFDVTGRDVATSKLVVRQDKGDLSVADKSAFHFVTLALDARNGKAVIDESHTIRTLGFALDAVSDMTIASKIMNCFALTGSGSIALATKDDTLTLTTDKSRVPSADYAGVFTLGSLSVTGDAVQTISGANTADGLLTVGENASVKMSGSWAGPVSVETSATLIAAGTASVAGDLTFAKNSTLDVSEKALTVTGKAVVLGGALSLRVPGKVSDKMPLLIGTAENMKGFPVASLAGAPKNFEFAMNDTGDGVILKAVEIVIDHTKKVAVAEDGLLSKLLQDVSELTELTLATGEKPVTVTVDADITVATLKVTGKGALTLVSDNGKKLTVTGKTVFAADTDIPEGAAVLTGYEITKGTTLTLHESPDTFGRRTTAAGVLKLIAPDAKTPIAMNYDACTQDAESGFGEVLIGNDTELRTTVTGPALFNVTGANIATSKMTLIQAEGDLSVADKSAFHWVTLTLAPESGKAVIDSKHTIRTLGIVLNAVKDIDILDTELKNCYGLIGTGAVALSSDKDVLTLATSKARLASADYAGVMTTGSLTITGDAAQTLSGANTSKGVLTVGNGNEKTELRLIGSWAGEVSVTSASAVESSSEVGSLTLAKNSVLTVAETPMTVAGKLTLPADGNVMVKLPKNATLETVILKGTAESLKSANLNALSGAVKGSEFALSDAGDAVIMKVPEVIIGSAYTIDVPETAVLSELLKSKVPAGADYSKIAFTLNVAKPAVLTVSEPVTLSSLTVAGSGSLRLVSEKKARLTVSEAVRITADTDIAAGAAVFASGYEIIGSSRILTVHENHAPEVFGKRLSEIGSVRFAGNTFDTALTLDYDACTGDESGYFGSIELADKTQLSVTITKPVRLNVWGRGWESTRVNVIQAEGDLSLSGNAYLHRVTLALRPQAAGAKTVIDAEHAFSGTKFALDTVGEIEISSGDFTVAQLTGNAKIALTGKNATLTAEPEGTSVFDGVITQGNLRVSGKGILDLTARQTTTGSLTAENGAGVCIRKLWSGSVEIGKNSTLSGKAMIRGNLTMNSGSVLDGTVGRMNIGGSLTLPTAARSVTVLLGERPEIGTTLLIASREVLSKVDFGVFAETAAGIGLGLNETGDAIVLIAVKDPEGVPEFIVPGATGKPTEAQAKILSETLNRLGADPAGKPVTVTVAANGITLTGDAVFAAAAEALQVFDNIAVTSDGKDGMTLTVAYTFGVTDIRFEDGNAVFTAKVDRPADMAERFGSMKAPAFADGVQVRLLDSRNAAAEGAVPVTPAAGANTADVTVKAGASGLFRVSTEKTLN